MNTFNPPAPFPNTVCWNFESRPRVLDVEALRVNAEVFRATHSPAPLRKRGSVAGAFVPIEESAYFNEFLTTSDPRGLDFAVGDSGTGKSHLIRWIALECEHRSIQEKNRWHVALIPRASSNLAAVV